MNTNKYLIASIAAAAWLFVYGFVVNGIFLADFWAESSTASLMRPEEELKLWVIVFATLAQGFALGFIFTRGYENRGFGEGVRFGLLVLWFIAGINLMAYALQPVDFYDVVVATITDGIAYIGAGVVLAALYKK